MSQTTDAVTQTDKIAELKRLITTTRFESLEKLEEAVDAFLWADEDEIGVLESIGRDAALPEARPEWVQ